MSATGLDSVEFPDSFVVSADGAFKVSDLVSAFGATETEVSDFGTDTAGVSTTTVTVSVFVSTS